MQIRTPKICVSLAKSDITGLRRDMGRAFEARAHYIEVRFDALKPALITSAEAFEAVRPFKEISVFTLRSKEQGGSFAGSVKEMASTLESLASVRPMLLDIELGLAMQMPGLIRDIEVLGVPVLLSHHDWNGTPSDTRLLDILSIMRERSSWLKIVTTASHPGDGYRMIRLYRHVDPSSDTKLVSFAMGEDGKTSRLASGLAVNSPFTFAALDDAVAPGQLTLKEMQTFYKELPRYEEVFRLLRQAD